MIRSKSTPNMINFEEKNFKRYNSFNNIRENFELFAEKVLPKPSPKVVSIWKEFRDFAFAGSVIDLAVGIIIGGAFGKIVHSLVNDIIMPPIGWLLSGVDFANIFILLKRGKKNKITQSRYKSLTQAKEDGAVTINIGVFLNSILNFVVISVIIFTFVRTINKLKKKKEPTSKQCPYCYSKIDQRAIRCAFCTSQLKENFNYLIKEEEEEEEKEDSYHLKKQNIVDQNNHHDELINERNGKKYIDKENHKYLKKNLKKHLHSTTFGFFF